MPKRIHVHLKILKGFQINKFSYIHIDTFIMNNADTGLTYITQFTQLTGIITTEQKERVEIL